MKSVSAAPDAEVDGGVRPGDASAEPADTVARKDIDDPLQDASEDADIPELGTPDGFVDAGKPCTSSGDCNDGLTCTVDVCDDSTCLNEPATNTCLVAGTCYEEGQAASDDVCQICKPDASQVELQALVCTADDPCEIADCAPLIGCVSAPATGQPCDDGDPCTEADACDDGGVCVGQPACDCATDSDCDDGLPCTVDSCAEPGKCIHDVEPDHCLSDGACIEAGQLSQDDACKVCNPAVASDGYVDRTCSTAETCYEAVCSPDVGCQEIPNDGLACDDGQACTTQDTCIAGVCQGIAEECGSCAENKLYCGKSGTCAGFQEDAFCACLAGHTGPGCASCDAGYAPDPSGSCVLCDCAPGEACEAGQCVCAPGYNSGSGGCVWGGIVQNPGFEDDSGWNLTSATVDGDSPGNIDPGAAVFELDGGCEQAAVRQTVEIPPYTASGPLALRVRMKCEASFGGCDFDALAVIGDDVHVLDASNQYRTRTVCLGEDAYGQTLPLSLRPFAWSQCAYAGPSADGPILDRVWIEPAEPGECASPGGIANGNFEAGADGWTLSGAGEIDVSGGEATITLADQCDNGRLEAPVSIPALASTTGAALRIEVEGTQGAYFHIGLDDRYADVVLAEEGSSGVHLCLPPGYAGSARTLQLSVTHPASGKDCSVPYDVSLSFDDVRWVSDPTCGLGTVLDGGFERAAATPNHAGWWRRKALWCNDAGNSEAAFVLDPSEAHTGQGVGLLRQTQEVQLRLETAVVLPPAPPSGGLALSFWTRGSLAEGAELIVQPSTSSGSVEVSSTWKRHRRCVPAGPGGPAHVVFMLPTNGGTPCDEVPTSEVWVDDVRLEPDPTCPSSGEGG